MTCGPITAALVYYIRRHMHCQRFFKLFLINRGTASAVPHLVGVTRFEHATSSSRTKRSTKLSHTPARSNNITQINNECKPFLKIFMNAHVICFTPVSPSVFGCLLICNYFRVCQGTAILLLPGLYDRILILYRGELSGYRCLPNGCRARACLLSSRSVRLHSY